MFEFEGLPAEIRNQIYELALVAPGPIKISRHENKAVLDKRPKQWHGTGMFARYGKRRDFATWFLRAEVTTVRRIERKCKFLYGKNHTPAVLRWNKTAYDGFHDGGHLVLTLALYGSYDILCVLSAIEEVSLDRTSLHAMPLSLYNWAISSGRTWRQTRLRACSVPI